MGVGRRADERVKLLLLLLLQRRLRGRSRRGADGHGGGEARDLLLDGTQPEANRGDSAGYGRGGRRGRRLRVRDGRGCGRGLRGDGGGRLRQQLLLVSELLGLVAGSKADRAGPAVRGRVHPGEPAVGQQPRGIRPVLWRAVEAELEEVSGLQG